MKKKSLKIQIGTLVFTLMIVCISCSKKDVNTSGLVKSSVTEQKNRVSTEDSTKLNLTEQAAKTLSTYEQTGSDLKSKKHPKERTLPVPKTEQSFATLSSSGTTYGCYGMMIGEYAEGGYYNYPQYHLNVDNNIGGTITLTAWAYTVPNRFTLLSPYGNIITQTGWIGTADYEGPWGSELYASHFEQITFKAYAYGDYTIQVETQTYNISDYWEVQIECVAPPAEVPIKSVTGITQLTNQILRNKIITNFFSGTNNLNPNVTYDLNSIELISYAGTDIQGAFIKEVNYSPNSANNHVAVIPVRGQLVSDMAMEVRMYTESDGSTRGDIFDSQGITVGSVYVDPNGRMSISSNPDYVAPSVSSSRIFTNLDMSSAVASHGPAANTENFNAPYFGGGWWKRWARCVGDGFTSFTSGDPVKTGIGLICALQAGPCVTGAVIGCAAAATFL